MKSREQSSEKNKNNKENPYALLTKFVSHFIRSSLMRVSLMDIYCSPSYLNPIVPKITLLLFKVPVGIFRDSWDFMKPRCTLVYSQLNSMGLMSSKCSSYFFLVSKLLISKTKGFKASVLNSVIWFVKIRNFGELPEVKLWCEFFTTYLV